MLTREAIGGFIRNSVTYLIQACGPDGRFVYQVFLDPMARVAPQYNIVRHAGAMYGMGLYLEQAPSDEVAGALLRAGSFLKPHIAAPPGAEWADTLALWSKPEVDGDPDGLFEAKLGGTGLGLCGLVAAEQVSPGFTRAGDLRAMGRYLLKMQRPDGSFMPSFVPSEGGPRRDAAAIYYPGEAILGLFALFEHDGEAVWFRAAERGLIYLAALGAMQEVPDLDHWTLLATAEWMRLIAGSPAPPCQDLILDHARRLVRAFLDRVPAWPADSPLIGCVQPNGNSCATSTQLEGLIAAWDVLSVRDPSLGLEIRSHIEAGLGYLLRCQVTSGPAAGGVVRAPIRLPEDGTEAIRAFNRSATEIRVDYVQHAASAFLAWRQILLEASRTAA
jgi:hypothetical protein